MYFIVQNTNVLYSTKCLKKKILAIKTDFKNYVNTFTCLILLLKDILIKKNSCI